MNQLAENEPFQAYVAPKQYAHVEFPKWKHHATEPSVVVHSEEEEDALGDGWVNFKSELEQPQEPAEASEEDELNALRQIAEEKGVEYDKRWGVKRLKSAVESALSNQ